ncbi:MAG TPA: sulfatase [Thermoanaerobaculia bacterium]|nr:sulfatase [Thermoanaerobaculia bacterium]
MIPVRWPVGLALALCLTQGCRPASDSRRPAADSPVHLEEQLELLRIEGSEVPEEPPAPVEWRFDEPRPEWKTVVPLVPGRQPAELSRVDGALRITILESAVLRRDFTGGIFLDLPAGWSRHDWAWVVVRARASDEAGNLRLGINLRKTAGETTFDLQPFEAMGESAHLVSDGAVHQYLLRPDWGEEGESEWRQLGLMVHAPRPASVDILSVSLLPKEAGFSKEKAGVVTEARGQVYRRALYTHAPGTISLRVKVPQKGRLDFGMGVLRRDVPVTFRVTAEDRGETVRLFEEAWADKDRWGQRSVDLARFAGKTIDLALEAAAPGRPGTVALWAAPTLSGARKSSRPNVILYVIDAGGALYTSAYGYNRRTTPNLERLAAEGALFERAYSNSTWSKPSTTSFMTGLQHSVLGGYENPSDPLPDQAVTLAQYLHGAGYQTGVFTSNTWCGTMSSLDRGVDSLRETVEGSNSASSEVLQEDFFRWRDAYPGEPYWVHFQTTDVHWPWEPVAPFAGTFISRGDREAFYDMERRLGAARGLTGRDWALRASPEAFEKAGVDWKAYFDSVRGVFDEAMLHADFQLGRLVQQLKDRGEWENTILIVTADHGDWPGLGYFDSINPAERIPNFNPYVTQVPLVVTWPRHIDPGQRFADPVSLIDLLPTILDLTGEPVPDMLQGQSLAPLLLGRPGWKPRPVILDEFNVDPKTKQLRGLIEIVDGRWGASLAVNHEGDWGPDVPPLVLYDLWNDPYCRRSLHKERPELVKKYTAVLQRQLREHLALAKKFTHSGEGAMNAEQIENLRSLGYIQ